MRARGCISCRDSEAFVLLFILLFGQKMGSMREPTTFFNASKVMIEIFRSRFGLKLREVYFSPSLAPSDTRRDLDVYIQQQEAVSGSKAFWTACLDLSSSEADLFQGMSKNFRYEINRAATRDKLQCTVDVAPDGEGIRNAVRFYDAFARAKGLSPANHAKLNVLNERGHLMLARVASADGDPLAMHCYITDGHRARLYYSATSPRQEAAGDSRQLLGRANKLLHWHTIKIMKDAGIACYDFGGISKSDSLKGIDDFKLQFGAVERQEANAIVPVSVLGHAALGLRHLIGHLCGKRA